MTRCVDCEAQFAGNWRFCPRCGNPISCPVCGTTRPSGQRFCPKDGHAFELRHAAEVKTCSSCDSVWEAGAKFCVFCGQVDAPPRGVPGPFRISARAASAALALVLLTAGAVYWISRPEEAAAPPVQTAWVAASAEPSPARQPVLKPVPAAPTQASAAPSRGSAAEVAAPVVAARVARPRPTVHTVAARAVLAPKKAGPTRGAPALTQGAAACGRGEFGKVSGLVVDARSYRLDSRFAEPEQENLAAAAAKSHYAVIEEDAHRVRPLYPPSALGENSAWWCAQLEGKRVEVSGCVFSARYHGGAAVVAQSAKVLP